MSASAILLAFGLAADAFAVAIGQGTIANDRPWRMALTVALAFGAAQAVAPLIGWSVGYWFAGLIESFDHWVAAGLLTLVGVKLIWDGNRGGSPETITGAGQPKTSSGWALLMLSIATSIDATAAGITLPTLGAPVLVSIAVIGAVTFALSFAGVWIGRAGSSALGPNAVIVGGLTLIVIAAKVLIDHRAFG